MFRYNGFSIDCCIGFYQLIFFCIKLRFYLLLCVLCQRENETYTHLFSDCEKISMLLKDLKEWIAFKTDNFVDFSLLSIIFGLHGKINYIPSLLMLLVKQYIYYCRRMKANVCIKELKSKIFQYYKIEKYNSKISGKLDNFTRRWNGWESLF